MEECLVRELREELDMVVDFNKIKKLGVFYKTKEIDGQDYEANVFVVGEVEVEKLKVNEGKGIVYNYPTELLKLGKLTRVTRQALEKYTQNL